MLLPKLQLQGMHHSLLELEGAESLGHANLGDHAQVVEFMPQIDQSSLVVMTLTNGNQNPLSHTTKILERNDLKEGLRIVLTPVLVEMIGSLKPSSKIRGSLKRWK